MNNLLKIIGLGVILPANTAFANNRLSIEWYQWMLSIPPYYNPMFDNSGEKCAIGQHGSVWFLADDWSGSPATTRPCSIPAGKTVYFPVMSTVYFDAPNVCGQGPDNISVNVMYALNASFIAGVANLSVEIDGKAIKELQHVRSKVFAITLPEDNIFDVSCADAGLGDVPGGIYSAGSE
ncbi:hypothetical protein [Candidatus Methylomicrobium oryzae]|uniref:hypothetical protein n=1 Tax=Candidatus Methylomicrobium oryzae TaxID=2802053 RepID=UPI00192378D1|nr:hypothetical protein [Methylomicrobium sp. RS1]MBL1263645.1 hypothetical protein [Methylomicrobium sp. RS1]